VAGDAQSTRVGNALAVHDNQVWCGWHRLASGDDGRRLAKGKQAGNVGKGYWATSCRSIHDCQARKRVDDDRGTGHVGWKCHVDARDQSDVTWVTSANDQCGQRRLNRDSFSRRDVPLVEIAQVHLAILRQ